MQEGLKDIPGLGDSNHTGSASVVDAIMEVINATGIHNFLAADVRAGQHADCRPELCHGPALQYKHTGKSMLLKGNCLKVQTWTDALNTPA